MTKREEQTLRKLTQEELDVIIEDHANWVDLLFNKVDLNKPPIVNTKANLSYVDISGLDLSRKPLVEVDFTGSNLEDVNFNFSNLILANFSHANVTNANFIGCNLNKADFTNTNITNATFQYASLDSVKFTKQQLDSIFITPNYNIENEKNIEDEASFEIKALKKELEEQKKKLSAQEGEEDKIKTATKLLEDKLEETEAILAKELAAKKSTKEDIDIGIGHLKAPNNYLKAQINIQYCLTILYGVLAIIAVIFLFHYIKDHYNEFKTDLTKETTFLQWLFYALPIAVCFSLIITFINQINSRLKSVIALHEKKRYVDSISGGLKAVQELSENNKEARSRISGVLDEILNNTITLSEKLQEDVLPDEKPIDNKVSMSVKDLKDFFSK
ncbi:pentapeptide repeat-containing protein [Kordia sp. YSTF-M3]|uniref:Pentapeptide repeat-containing protein n=1 Tax=Kordia aestuariivivens TaxID=2759037 RepID=A0ABR7QCL4_9FLAO|nr:pentapeptide repeat-containing protein [Kordia aestuariivivens]MBC8756294.1 pentapeptide repeat-containing protein [Kordia aestuariivivens]